VSDLYITTVGLPILLEDICGPILGIYKRLTNVEIGTEGGRAILRKGIHKGNFCCSAGKLTWIASRRTY
jgi:hypothetical protein